MPSNLIAVVPQPDGGKDPRTEWKETLRGFIDAVGREFVAPNGYEAYIDKTPRMFWRRKEAEPV